MQKRRLLLISMICTMVMAVIGWYTIMNKIIPRITESFSVFSMTTITFKQDLQYEISSCEIEVCRKSANAYLIRYMEILDAPERCFQFGPDDCYISRKSKIGSGQKQTGDISEISYLPRLGLLHDIVAFTVISKPGSFKSYHYELPGYSVDERIFGLVNSSKPIIVEIKRIKNTTDEISNDERHMLIRQVEMILLFSSLFKF